MTFVRPWVLVLLVAVLAWAVWEWRLTRRRGALILKVLMAALVVLALAQPKLTIFEQKVALALLADTSASIPPDDLRKASDLLSGARAGKGRNNLQVIPFAGAALRLEEGRELRSEGRSTNLEAAIRAAIGVLPRGRVPRVLLISDGRENSGSVERALYQARLLGVPIDTYALDGTRQPALQLESVALPAQAFTGEKFYIEVSVLSPRATTAQVELTAEGRSIGRAEVKLVEGRNSVRVRAQLDAGGATHVSGSVRAADLGQVHFDRVVSLRRPRLLLVNSDPADTTRHLRQVLAAARFEVDESTGGLPARLRDYQVILANNHDVEAWPLAAKTRLEEYVREGGGFGLIAGEHNIYVEHKEDDDPLNRMLPAKLAPPRTPEGTAVVLIVDKSSSMEGKKMELARLSAIGVVSNLRPIDLVGVLIFDNSFQWAVPIRKADNPALIKRLIAGITPDGGTQIAPALSEAFRQIRNIKAVYRHIVLLTDGISEEGDSMATSREAANLNITISTVGLGQDVNRAYLEKVATTAKGKPYFVLELGNLEQLLLRDVMEHTGSSAIEKPLQAEVLREVEVLEDTGIAKAPPLLGYLKFVSKPQAETILQVDGKDPLLARWQYGLGRSIVFASDAKARWAANWVDWPGFDKLWTNLLRDLLPRAPETEARAEFDQANGEILVRYRVQAGQDLTGPPPQLYVIGPDNFKKAVPLERLAPASYQAKIPIESRQGLFRIRAATDLDKFPEVGYYREEPELAEYGSNPELLRQIAASTGGRFNPTPRQFFDAGNNSVSTTMDLWPGLLALAVLLNLLELAARKGYTPARLWARR
jgi:Ca-activated chloride channel family protein